MFKVSLASLQTFIDTPNSVLEDRVQYSTFHIPIYSVMVIFNSSIVWGLLCTVIVRCRYTFWSPCILLD